MINAYIFDLDGTLLDSEVLWVESVERFMVKQGQPLSHEEAVGIVYGRSWGCIYKDLSARLRGAYPTIASMEAPLQKEYDGLRATRDIRIQSSIELLKTLARDRPVAVVSGSTRKGIEKGMALADVTSHVRLYLGTEDYSPGKPHPACYRLAAERLNLPPEQCLAFEDSAAGVAAAKAAGMKCVALQREGAVAQDFTPADQVLADLADFRPEDFQS